MMNSIFYKKLHFIQGFEQLQKEGIELTKLIVFHEHPEYIREIKEELEAKFPELSCTSSFPTNIEINIKNAKKGVALAEYIKELGIQRDEVMVFGDGLNDYSMFEEFSHSYAPSNAMDEIKEIASEVVESNREDGVGKTIYRKMTNF